ncbi:MAG TPA: hypothetical protein VGS03_01775 [Candidatus Polarisedimenticolia bacterium]|nr:hypothetical protein [Candidatus Polarisedimenticolia bacterium]
MESPIEVVEAPREPIGEGSPREAFLDENRIVPQRREQLPEPLRHARAAGHALELALEHRAGHGRVPEALERGRLLQVRLDLPFPDLPRDRFLERLRRAELV